MAVDEVRLVNAGGSQKGREPGDVSRTLRATFKVHCDSQIDMMQQVWDKFKLDTSLPYHGRTFNLGHGFDGDVICVGLDPQHIEKSGGWWEVTATFDPIDDSSGGEAKPAGIDGSGKATEDPLEYATEIETSFSPISEPVERARFLGFVPEGIKNPHLLPNFVGPVINSAGIPMDPTFEEETWVKVVRITFNRNLYDHVKFDAFQGTYNGNFVTMSRPGFGFHQTVRPMCGKLVFYGASLGFENGKFFWRETKEVHIHPRSWVREIVDRGLSRRRAFDDPDGEGGTISTDDLPEDGGAWHEVIKDVDDYPITEPVLLNGNGQPLEPGKDPVYLRWMPWDRVVDWTGISW